MGCAGHAPDPAKRLQVIELKSAYMGVASMADKHKLPAERRKALDILTNCDDVLAERSEEHTSELQSLMRISYAVFCLKKNRLPHNKTTYNFRQLLTTTTPAQERA